MTWPTGIAAAVLVVAAVAGTVLALGGAPEVALVVWAGGGLLAASIVFLAPWLFLFLGRNDAPDPQ